ncbi:hypothetical protein TNCV_2597031 [Trichonephila clavipes]|nr:hypothetical protein TNCV_2597031 [Trichonephila clavipes]
MLKGQSLSLWDNKPFAVRSDLGWIVAGNVPSEDMFSSIAVNSIQVVTDELVSNLFGNDLLSGAATEKEAVELVWQLKEMMKKGGFNLLKWQSNSEIVIKEVAENKDLKRVQTDEEIKILGIQ